MSTPPLSRSPSSSSPELVWVWEAPDEGGVVLDPRDFPDVLRIERMRAKADNLVAGSCVLLFLGVVALGLDVLDLAGTCICTGLGWVAILWLPAVLFTLALDLWIMSGCVREGVETRTVGFLAGLRMGDW